MNYPTQILIHLSKFIGEGNEYEYPYEVTRFGVAKELGISEHQASVQLLRLRNKGMITYVKAHAHLNTRVRVQCFQLTDTGLKEVARIKEIEHLSS